MRPAQSIVFVISALLFPGVGQGEIYKCKQADGRTLYADTPCSEGRGESIKPPPSVSGGGTPGILQKLKDSVDLLVSRLRGAAGSNGAAGAVGEQSRAKFACDGRTYCSQMNSCDEATYFIQNCPDTKMDGDRDGVPCEQQWCR